MGGLLVDLSPGVLIWGPFWVSVWGLGVESFRFGGPFGTRGADSGPLWVSVGGLAVEGCWQQLKTSKIRTHLQRQADFAQKTPLSVLVVPRDSRVFPYPKSQKHANHDG